MISILYIWNSKVISFLEFFVGGWGSKQTNHWFVYFFISPLFIHQYSPAIVFFWGKCTQEVSTWFSAEDVLSIYTVNSAAECGEICEYDVQECIGYTHYCDICILSKTDGMYIIYCLVVNVLMILCFLYYFVFVEKAKELLFQMHLQVTMIVAASSMS